MKKLIIIAVLFLSSCTGGNKKFDGLILTDTATKKVYLLKHNVADNYFIDEQYTEISGKDTITHFK